MNIIQIRAEKNINIPAALTNEQRLVRRKILHVNLQENLETLEKESEKLLNLLGTDTRDVHLAKSLNRMRVNLRHALTILS